MPWCPQCKIEYLPHVQTCSDCRIPLVDYNPAEPVDGEAEAVYLPHVWLASVTDQYESAQLLALLESRGIRFYPATRGRSAYMKHYAGAVITDADVFVAEADLERARELLETIRQPQAVQGPEDGEEDYGDLGNRMALIKRIFTLLIVGLPALAILLMILVRLL